MSLIPGARLWAPYRALQDVVNAAIHKREAGSIHDLELALRRHKPDFISLLKVPVSFMELKCYYLDVLVSLKRNQTMTSMNDCMHMSV